MVHQNQQTAQTLGASPVLPPSPLFDTRKGFEELGDFAFNASSLGTGVSPLGSHLVHGHTRISGHGQCSTPVQSTGIIATWYLQSETACFFLRAVLDLELGGCCLPGAVSSLPCKLSVPWD